MRDKILFRAGVLILACVMSSLSVVAQSVRAEDEEFGPVVRAYLKYLHNEQEVVDDRASRHEVSPAYYRRNLNRIRALRQMAIRIARETDNDYLPELDAAARDELRTLFEAPPRPESLRVGEIINNTFRYLGVSRAGEVFYIFERLDPYEQADLMLKAQSQTSTDAPASTTPAAASVSGKTAAPSTTVKERPRRGGTP